MRKPNRSKNRLTEPEVVKECLRVFDEYGIRYKTEAPLEIEGTIYRVDIYLMDCQIAFECKAGCSTKNIDSQIGRYKTGFDEVWVIFGRNCSTLIDKYPRGDRTLFVGDLKNHIAYIKDKIDNY